MTRAPQTTIKPCFVVVRPGAGPAIVLAECAPRNAMVRGVYADDAPWEEMRAIVGGDLECVASTDRTHNGATVDAFADETGRMKLLAPNAKIGANGTDWAVGTIVVCARLVTAHSWESVPFTDARALIGALQWILSWKRANAVQAAAVGGRDRFPRVMLARPNVDGFMVGTCPHCGETVPAEEVEACESCDLPILVEVAR